MVFEEAFSTMAKGGRSVTQNAGVVRCIVSSAHEERFAGKLRADSGNIGARYSLRGWSWSLSHFSKAKTALSNFRALG